MKKTPSDKERIALLEAKVKQLKAEIEDIEALKINELEDRMDELETKLKKLSK